MNILSRKILEEERILSIYLTKCINLLTFINIIAIIN
jgi:hypothetical protein